jgi:hypothetical protein
MDKQMIDIFCKQIETELEKISKLPTLTDATLNNLHKLTDTKKNLLKIEKLEMEMGEGMDNGYSNRNMPTRGGSYDNMSNRYPHMPIYGGSYDYGYSRNDAYSHLEAAMRDARNEQEREEIRQLMARYHN